jgi:hypothetical protein
MENDPHACTDALLNGTTHTHILQKKEEKKFLSVVLGKNKN